MKHRPLAETPSFGVTLAVCQHPPLPCPAVEVEPWAAADAAMEGLLGLKREELGAPAL